MRNAKIITLLLIFLLLQSCYNKSNKKIIKKKEARKTKTILTKENKNLNEVNIYVVGYEYNDSKFEGSIEELADEVGMKHVVKLWKNGKDIPLENNEFYSDAEAVVVKNQDIYVVGAIVRPHEECVATMWKNGKTQKLTDGIKTAYTKSLCIDNNNIYVLGAKYDSINYVVKVWKNGISTDVIRSDNWIDVSSMFIYKEDVFICGHEQNGDRDEQRYRNNSIAKIWKNGKAQNLTDGHNNAYALSLYIENGIVYVVGFEIENNKYTAKLWIDGKAQNISDSKNNTIANSIFISKGNVYIAGRETINGIEVAKLWINGKAQNLSNGNYRSIASSVFVHKNNIYVVGFEKNDNDRDVAKLWINGEVKELTDGTKNGYANSIFVEDVR